MPSKIPAAPGSETFVSVDSNAGRLSRDLYLFFVSLISALTNRVSVTGAAAFAGGTTATVTFDVAEANASYDVFFSPPDNKTYWATSKATTGFTANSSAGVTASVRWALIRA